MVEQLEKYIENIKEIRGLSMPQLDPSLLPEQYEPLLHANFGRIERLAEENQRILDEVLFPALQERRVPDGEEISELLSVGDALINGASAANLDLPLGNRILRYLWELDPVEDAEWRLMLGSLYIDSCYRMFSLTGRTFPYSDERERFREEGCRICDVILSCLEHDRWSALPTPDAKRLVLDLAACKSAFYEGVIGGRPKRQQEDIDILRRALAVAEDAWYRDGLTEEQWSFYLQGVRESYGLLLEAGNKYGLGDALCTEICGQMEAFKRQWETEPDGWKPKESRAADLLSYYRSAYFAGKMSKGEYAQKLRGLYQERDEAGYEPCDILMNLLLPVEYHKLVFCDDMPEHESGVQERMCRDAVRYVCRAPDSGAIVYLLEYLLQFLEEFCGSMDGMTYEETVLDCMCALHLPTYIHSKMVAILTRCLCGQLLRVRPELFLEFTGEDSAEAVLRQEERIVDFAYHAALCHDFGKLAVMDTVRVYGRELFDCEWAQIRSHSELGAAMLEKNASTAGYANVALAHHRWYDDSMGYPFLYEDSVYPEKVIIDLVACADCMDAATGTWGRSKNRGKSLDDYISEVEEAAGTRYAPWLPELLRREEVRAQLERLLAKERDRLVRESCMRRE